MSETDPSQTDATRETDGDEDVSLRPRLRVVADNPDSDEVRRNMGRLAIRYFGERADDALHIDGPDDTPPPAA